jgi:CRP/FNR family transcriptional regulator, cyclic AMP receptor protein
MTPANQDPESWPPTSLIGQLPPTERGALLDAGTSAQFSDDEVIVRQGDQGTGMFVLLRGLVKIRVAAESGSNTVLAVLSRGDLVGEFALIDGSPRNATAIAVGDVTGLHIRQTAFARVTEEYPALQVELTKYMVSKIRARSDRQAADRFWPARARLAQVLYDLATTRLEPDADAVYRLPMTQAGLGELAGVGQSTAERELGKFRDEGAIETHYRLIEIRDLQYLDGIRFSS